MSLLDEKINNLTENEVRASLKDVLIYLIRWYNDDFNEPNLKPEEAETLAVSFLNYREAERLSKNIVDWVAKSGPV